MERPSAAMATKAPITETGIAMEMTRVARKDLRKSNRMSAARVPPTKMFWRTKSMAELM